MPNLSMSAVVGLGVCAVKLAHAAREVRHRGFDEKVIMIIHQTIGMTYPAESLDNMRKDRKKCFSVGVVLIDYLLGISPTCDMIHCTGKLDSQWSGHAQSLTKDLHDCKT